MPKILGRDASLLKQCTCKQCASIIEYAPNELRSGYSQSYMPDKHGQWSWGDTYYEWVDCPQCRNRIYVHEGQHVPKYGYNF